MRVLATKLGVKIDNETSHIRLESQFLDRDESLVEVCNICSVRDENLGEGTQTLSAIQLNYAACLPLRTFKKGTCKVTKTNDYPEFTTLSEREN